MIATPPKCILVMGVAGAGKSTLGARLARHLDLPFIEGDDFHDAEARDLIARGIGLGDADRWPWLGRIAAAIPPAGAVIACSALKRAYRARLNPDWTVHLALPEALARARLASRTGHFAGPALAASQAADLEPLGPDEVGVTLDASLPGPILLEQALAALR